MKLSFSQSFNIRQKLVFIFFISLLSIGLLGSISIYNFAQIEEKFIVVESADDLSNIILEIRRYEKNYFLYSREDDFNETKHFVNEGKKLLNEIQPNINNQEQLKVIAILSKELKGYEEILNKIHSSGEMADSFKNQLIDDLRFSGHKLVQLSKNLVNYERKLILQINDRLTNNFLLSIVLITCFFLFFIIFIMYKIMRPLKIIEGTTQKIAKGEFKKVAVWKTNDEIQQVIVAFNKMVDELEARQDQLIQAQKLSSIGTLTSGIAHQVNNPLNNISSSCQIMMEECKDITSDLAYKMMQNIESETFRARDIVRGLLEFSRNEEFILTENRLCDIVDRSLKLVSSQIPSGIEILSRISESIQLNLDRQRMHEVFLNLFLNAIHAIQPDSGRVMVTAAQDDEKKQVIISVEDSGKGIPAEIRNQIFDPFFTTKDTGSGTGLGLYIVYGIVQLHRGRIHVETLLQGGTRFVIELPIDLAIR